MMLSRIEKHSSAEEIRHQNLQIVTKNAINQLRRRRQGSDNVWSHQAAQFCQLEDKYLLAVSNFLTETSNRNVDTSPQNPNVGP